MFRIISDLHLEGMSEYKLPKVDGEKDTVLILAGDICEFQLFDTHNGYRNFLRDCNDRFKQVLYVPGNHEYYGSSIHDFNKYKKIIEKEYKNIKLVNCETVDIQMPVTGKQINFKIVCATLWTDMNREDPLTMVNALTYMGKDFQSIQDFSPEVWVSENKKARSFIRYSILDAKETSDPVIVITHHGPTMKSIRPKYKNLGHLTNSLFMNTGLEEIFDETSLKLWVHGHTHDSVDHLLGHGCKVVANPKGITSLSFFDNRIWMKNQNDSYDELLTLFAKDLYF